jgi:hypothetical protein
MAPDKEAFCDSQLGREDTEAFHESLLVAEDTEAC